MCTNYTPATPSDLSDLDRIDGLQALAAHWPAETFPGYAAPLLLAGEGGHLRLHTGSYGLVPRWCRDRRQAETVSRRTYNARGETVAEKPSYRQPWRERRWAVAPMLDFFEPCWETGRAVRWRIRLADAPLFGAAGLHETWTDPHTGERVTSFTLLTVNADGHDLMRRMHRSQDEKRMLVLLPPADWARWLLADTGQALRLLQEAGSRRLAGEPAPARPERQQALGF